MAKSGKWFVRAEIVGDFVERWEFDTDEECTAFVNQLISDGIWDNIDFWKE